MAALITCVTVHSESDDDCRITGPVPLQVLEAHWLDHERPYTVPFSERNLTMVLAKENDGQCTADSDDSSQLLS